MRRTVPSILLLIAAMLLAGCQSPSSRWAAQRVALTSFERAVLDAHTAGIVTDVDFAAMDTGVQAGRAWLAAAAEPQATRRKTLWSIPTKNDLKPKGYTDGNLTP